MKAIIQAGGMGSRLRPVTLEIPKPLVPVKKKPIINHIVEFLSRNGIEEVGVIINEGHREDFERWKKQWKEELPKVPISIFTERVPMGTFGYLRNLKEWFGGEPFILANGDGLVDFDLGSLISLHKKLNPVATKALRYVEGLKGSIGLAELEGDYITKFEYIPSGVTSGFISIGWYVLDPSILSYDVPSKEFVIIETDVFPRLAKEKKLCGLKLSSCRFFDCGTLERWEKAIEEW